MVKILKPIRETIVEIYGQALSIIKHHPTILILFLILGMVDFGALMVLYFAPSDPVNGFLGPVISRLFGERFLHYPDNFLLLPRLYKYAHFAVVSSIGLIITGLVIRKVEAQARDNEHVSTAQAGFLVIKKYIGLLLIWIVTYAAVWFLMREVAKLKIEGVVLQFVIYFGIALVSQSLFAFLFPAILIEKKNFFINIGSALFLGVRNLISTMALIAVPVFFAMVMSFLKSLSPFFVQFNPDLVLWVLILGVVVSMGVDLVITACSTLLYLRVRESK